MPTLSTDLANFIKSSTYEQARERLGVVRVISVKQYDAVGDGVADDTTPINNTIAAVVAAGGGVVYFPPGTYLISSTITITTSNVIFRGEHPAIIKMTADANAIVFDGSLASLTTTLSASLFQNQKTLTLTSSTGVSSGQLLSLKSNKAWYYGTAGTKGELLLIDRVESGNVIELGNETQDNYDLSDETVEAIVADGLHGIVIETIQIEFSTPRNRYGVVLSHCIKPQISQVRIKFAANAGVRTVRCFQFRAINCDVSHSNFASLGYGISCNEGCFDTVENCHFVNCRRGVDFSGLIPSRLGYVSGCSVAGGGRTSAGNSLASSGYGTHETAIGCVFQNNRVSGVTTGFVIRGSDNVVQNNASTGNLNFVYLTEAGDCVIKGNQCFDNLGPGSALSINGSSAREYSPTRFLDIPAGSINSASRVFVHDNICRGLRNDFIRTGSSFYLLDVKNNSVSIASDSAGKSTRFIGSANACTIANIVDFGNTVMPEVGTYTRISANITYTPLTVIGDGQ
jgi:hypothetical protein